MIEFVSNGVDSNMPDDYATWIFFSKKTQMLKLNSLLSEVLVTEVII